MRLYDRQMSLTISRSEADQFFRTTRVAVITGLRVQFSIEKSLRKQPNDSEIVVTNLSAESRAALQASQLHIQLDAGYDGATKRLFAGDVRLVQNERVGADWETRIELGDGERAYRRARVSKSFRRGVTRRSVIAVVARAMGLRLPTGTQAKALAAQFVSGVTVNGPAHRELTRLLGPQGLGWSVQDGALQILREGESRAEQALVISQDTGLLGSPAPGTPNRRGGPPITTLRTLLFPEVLPGRKVQAQSRSVNGVFRVDRVVHLGDTRGDDWATEIEARPHE